MMTFSFSNRTFLLLSASALSIPSAAFADADEQRDYLGDNIIVTAQRESYLEDDGSSATKTPTPLINVPQSVAVITEDQLEDQGTTQLRQALRFVPGVSLETGEGHRDEVFIRGQETTADFYLDGLRDDTQYYRALYNIERVEVLKGANALIFGRGAGGGAINRVAKMANIDSEFANFDAALGTFAQGSLAADINLPTSMTTGVRLNTTYERFDNDRDFYNGEFFGVSPSFTAELGEDTRLTAIYSDDRNNQVTDRGVPSFNNLPLMGFDSAFFGADGFNNATSDVHIARVRLDHDFSEQLSVNASVQYAHYDKIYANILPRGTDGTTVELSGYEDFTTRENLIGQINLIWQGDTGGIGHTLLAGAEVISQDTANGRANVLFDDDGFGGGASTVTSVALAQQISLPGFGLTATIRSRQSELTTMSFYLQDQIELAQWLDVVAGIRYDEFRLDTLDVLGNQPLSRDDNLWSPRFGVIVKPSEQISIYASYSESFLPQSGDQFLVLSNTTAAFEPEKFENIEAGIKWALMPELFFTAAIFRLDRSNTRAADPNNTGLTVLTGASRTEGVELSLAGSVTPDFHVNLGYTYMDGQITSDSTFGNAGARLQQLPEHQLGLWGRYDVSQQLGLGLGVIHQSDQFASFSNTAVLPGYTRVDAAVFFEVSDNVSLQLNIENLLDESYYSSAHGNNNIQPGDPISATFGARLKF